VSSALAFPVGEERGGTRCTPPRCEAPSRHPNREAAKTQDAERGNLNVLLQPKVKRAKAERSELRNPEGSLALKGCGATLTFALSKSKGCELIASLLPPGELRPTGSLHLTKHVVFLQNAPVGEERGVLYVPPLEARNLGSQKPSLGRLPGRPGTITPQWLFLLIKITPPQPQPRQRGPILPIL
jgi:hypothetical protein